MKQRDMKPKDSKCDSRVSNYCHHRAFPMRKFKSVRYRPNNDRNGNEFTGVRALRHFPSDPNFSSDFDGPTYTFSDWRIAMWSDV